MTNILIQRADLDVETHGEEITPEAEKTAVFTPLMED